MKKISMLLAVALFLSAFNLMPLSPVSNPNPQLLSAGFSTLAKMDLYANIETIGVVVSGTNLPKTAELSYRKDSETDWHSGHPLMRIDTGRLVGSLFGLSPATTYNIKVLDGSTEISGSIITQPDELQFTPTTVLYVDDDAPTGGDGSKSKPFKTIQEGVNHASAGTQVLVSDGVYREAVSFPTSGSANNWIQVKAEGSGAIRGREKGGSHHEHIGARGSHRADRIHIDAAIDRDTESEAQLLARGGQDSALREARADKGLAPKAGVDGHNEYEIDEREHLQDRGRGCRRDYGYAGLSSEAAYILG